ncbi:MAG: SPOR domain-containing protein [Rhodobacteraceae bacterium]|nr:SPOR domain-containing protein [Paracoccaceae bacterium]
MRLTACLALVLGLTCGTAEPKTLDEVSGPAELPPKGYSANQYIDSEGCVFLRAGYAGQVTWVPRVDRNRNVICGRTPTFPKTAAAVTVTGIELIPFEKSGCNFAPEMVQRFTLSDGRSFVNCGEPVADPVAYLNGLGRADLKVTGTAPADPAAESTTAAPAPAAAPPAPAAVAPAPAAGQAAAEAPAPAEGGLYIQVGAFAVSGNAGRAVRILADAGIPASARPGQMKGRALEFVVAGPFASRAEATEALRVVRRSGFPDAFIR